MFPFREAVSLRKAIVICPHCSGLALASHGHPASVVEFRGLLVADRLVDSVFQSDFAVQLHHFQQDTIALLVVIHGTDAFLIEAVFESDEVVGVLFPASSQAECDDIA